MGKYSNIDSIHIKNFKSLGDIDLHFGKNKILALRGLGESGKSSVIKAISCCLSNKDATKQKRYIRNGTKGFSVSIKLEDGINIQRIKTDIDNIVSVKGGGIDYRTNKIDRGSAIIEALYKVAGISCENETKEFLHYRSYDDLLLFVNTSGSTNFKVIRDILNLEELTQAIKNGNKACNSKKSDISSNLKYKKDLESNYENIKVVDLDSLDVLVKRMTANIKLLDDLKALKEIQRLTASIKVKLDNLETLGYTEVLDISKGIKCSFTGLQDLSSVLDVKCRLKDLNTVISKYTVLDSIEKVDITRLNELSMLRGIHKLNKDVSEQGIKLNLCSNLSNTTKLDFNMLSYLSDLREVYASYVNIGAELNILNKLNKIRKLSTLELSDLRVLKGIRDKLSTDLVDMDNLDSNLKGVIDEIKISGYNYCTNCNYVYK